MCSRSAVAGKDRRRRLWVCRVQSVKVELIGCNMPNLVSHRYGCSKAFIARRGQMRAVA